MAADFSALLNSAMDCIGYSKRSIVSRADALNKLCEIFSKTLESVGIEMLLAGSKSEGVVPFHASDYDLMFVFNRCLCVDVGCHEDGLVIIETYNGDCPPGYTKLRPLNIEHVGNTEFLQLCTVYDISTGVILLKSSNFQQFLSLCNYVIPFYAGFQIKEATFSGPAISVTLQTNIVKGLKSASLYGDQVPALPYYSSSFLQEWTERERIFNWPSPVVIQEVSTMEGYVVTVGHKLSEEQNFEWRICYTTAERKLVSSLSEVKLKLYILLKMVNSDIIKPKVDCVSSYIIKNIIFWIAEWSPAYVFTPSKLTHMLLQCLRLLLHCLCNNCLPNYMIPSRNLLLGKINSEQKLQLISLLQELLNEGDKIVLRCDKLRNAMYIMHNDRSIATRFRLWRDEVEELFLIVNLKMVSKLKPNMMYQQSYIYDMFFEFWKDESYLTELFRLLNLLSVDVPTLLTKGTQGMEDVNTWINNLLS
ncbi:uncharacterized protein LOC128548634 [Mercenaria mercenaria]|uniref:uncharacterized protein LOC128548634 n=1 Tax=Mercenaria mercenaria TaxID=6596 RepID=UPI00234F38D9|nr:uncharacterized protein LOC128548634 [Mercenaria mercenaria]